MLTAMGNLGEDMTREGALQYEANLRNFAAGLLLVVAGLALTGATKLATPRLQDYITTRLEEWRVT